MCDVDFSNEKEEKNAIDTHHAQKMTAKIDLYFNELKRNALKRCSRGGINLEQIDSEISELRSMLTHNPIIYDIFDLMNTWPVE